ncbi:MAG: hypothetical protein AAFP18_04290 [Bacteroidota bacterium]
MEKVARRNKRPTVVGVLIFVLVAALVLLFAVVVVALLNRLESDLAVPIIAASATILVSVITIVLSKYYEQRVKIEQEIRDEKIPIYEDLIGVFFNYLFAEKTGDRKPTDQEVIKSLASVTPKLVVWASEDVINSWNKMRSQDWSSADSHQALVLWDELLLAIRKDLGNGVDKLEKYGLLKLFVNDL